MICAAFFVPIRVPSWIAFKKKAVESGIHGVTKTKNHGFRSVPTHGFSRCPVRFAYFAPQAGLLKKKPPQKQNRYKQKNRLIILSPKATFFPAMSFINNEFPSPCQYKRNPSRDDRIRLTTGHQSKATE